jgi:enoyl-CoA hydratase
MTYKNIILEKKGHIGIIKINRPKALNALDKSTVQELLLAVAELEDDTKIKAAILTGEGKAFIAGADIKQMKDMTPLEAKEFAELGHRLPRAIEDSRLAFIAAVNGYALGGGCEMMMACDICIASTKAVIGQPEINLGIHPGFGGTQRLPRIVGLMKAKEMLLTGRNLKAEEARDIGLINKIVEPESLMETVEQLAQEIIGKSAVQTAYIKALVNKGSNIDLNSACDLEISYFSMSFSTHDQKEGMTAFLEKRNANFKDE